MDGLGCADGDEALLVEGAENFGLGLEAHVAYFVQEEGAVISSLEGPAFFRRASGDGAVAVAEELAFDEIFGNGSAVQLDEDAVMARAFGVDGAGDEFFAGTGFSIDEDATIGGGHELDLLAYGLGGDAFAGDGGFESELAFVFEIFVSETACLDSIFHDDQSAFEQERLFEEVEGSKLGGFDGGFDGGVAGDDDDFGAVFGGERAHIVEHVEAVAIW